MLDFFLTLWLFSGVAAAFQFPKIKFVGLSTKEDLNAPQRLVESSPEEAENLRRSLEKYCDISSSGDEIILNDNISFRWEPALSESYEVADVIFQEVARVLRDGYDQNQRTSDEERTVSSLDQLVLSFPSISRSEDLDKLSSVLQSDECKQLLGVEDARAELYPSSPAPYLRIKFSTQFTKGEAAKIDKNVVSNARSMPTNCPTTSTENWVNNFLGKYRLCPYTSSISRAAVGLLSVGVPVGGVHVRVESTNTESDPTSSRSYNILRAAELVSSFWSEVVTLMHSAQEDWSTSLIVFPEYDNEFESFVDVCDAIVEPTVVATQSTNVIGRAWFHPKYDADAVGHSEVIAGHAVPHKMVEGFMKSLHLSGGGNDRGLLEYDELVEANNRVRRTPHATINILRRSQLSAAGEYERGLGEKQPKANSIYVQNAVRLSKKLIKITNL